MNAEREKHKVDIEGVAARLGVPFQGEIDDAQADPSLLARLPLSFARESFLLPLREKDGRIIVAAGNPADLLAIDELRGEIGRASCRERV